MSTIVQTGFKLAQTVISNGAVTGNEWSNPNNLLLSDGDVSESNPGAGVASDVIIGNFLASVPSNAVIVGIELQIIGYRGSQTSPVLTIQPTAVDNTSGSDVYYPYVTPFTGLTPDLASYVLGGPTYLFATAWTPDMINNFKLMLMANGDIYIDAALVNVYYYIPDTPLPPPPPPTGCDDCNSPVQAQAFYLAQPFLSGDRYAYLQSFNYPDGSPIQYADLGSCGGSIKFVFDEGVPKVGTSNFEENAECAVWTVQPNGTVQLDFGNINVFRGLMFHTPYTADAALRSNHDAQSKVIISNSGPFYGQYLQRCQIGSVISAPIQIKEEGAVIVSPAVKVNFKGAGVSVAVNGLDPEQADVTINGDTPTTPVVTNVGSATSGSVRVSSLQFDVTTSGINRGLLVQISTEAAATITGITFNGVALTQQVAGSIPAIRNEQWFLVAPPLGTYPVIITLSAPAYISAGGEALVSVNQSTPIGATNRNGGNSLTPSVSLSTTVDNSNVFDGLTTAQTPILYTPGPSQVSEWHFTANADAIQGSSSYLPAGTAPDAITMQYSITQNTAWEMTAVEVIGLIPPSITDDHKVKVDGADTTPDFLDPKISMVSGDASVLITKTILNIGANEVIRYDFRVSGGGGGGSGGSPIFIDQTPSDGTYGLLAGAVDGVNKTFTVSQGIFATSKLSVYLNGLIQLQGAGDDWTETNPATGVFDFDVAPLAGDVITVVYQTTASTAGGAPFSVNQIAHGFTVGQVIRPTINQWTKSQGDTAAHAEAWAEVTVVIDVNNFTATPLVGIRQQQANIVALIAGFAGGDAVYVSAAVAGALTNVAPVAVGQVTKPVGYVEANDIGVPISLLTVNYRGQVNQATPVSGTIPVSGDVPMGVTGTDIIAHGLGVIPRLILLKTVSTNPTGSAGTTLAHGSATMDIAGAVVNQQESHVSFPVSNGIAAVNNKIAVSMGNGGGSQYTATISAVDAIHFTITWSATPSSGTYQWEAFA